MQETRREPAAELMIDAAASSTARDSEQDKLSSKELDTLAGVAVEGLRTFLVGLASEPQSAPAHQAKSADLFIFI